MTISVLPVTVQLPTRLQCLDVPIIDDQVCKNAYPGMISPRMVCAGYMDGGRDACNVSFTVNVYVWKNESLCTCSHSLPLFVRVTPAALWCVLERSKAWCHGVRDVPSLTILESTSRCASTSTGLKTPWQPTPKKIINFSSLLPLVSLHYLAYITTYSYFLLKP